MLRSMFSAVSGLRSHQTMMDVTGNNVANVNTAGYKATRTTFQETLTQLTRGGTAGVAGGGGQGGINPMQLGLGSQVVSTDLIYSQGASQTTGRATDVAIQGDGFFVVQGVTAEPRYMRAGSFSLDNQGQLVTPAGFRVQGYQVDAGGNLLNGPDDPLATIVIDPEVYNDLSISGNGTVMARNAASGELEVVGQLALARFANPGGLVRDGNGLFTAAAASGNAIVGAPGNDGLGTLQAGMLEMSNVDLAQEFTNLILAQRGFQANARTISTSDEMLQELVNLKR
jgi:flagellar hook protein FlgE